MTIKIFTVEQMIAAERAAYEAGHPYATMMEMAGFGAAKAITDKWAIQGKKFLVLVGPGNNGGDGLVAGRYLYQMGADVFLYLWKRERDESDINYTKVVKLDIPMAFEAEDPQRRFLSELARDSEYIVDALLGIGLNRPLSPELKGVLETVQQAINPPEIQASTRPDSPSYADLLPSVQPDPSLSEYPAAGHLQPTMIAIDCPTGLNCNTGEVDPQLLPADLTLTFAGPKVGHLLYPGAELCGQLKIVDIGLLPTDVASVPVELVTTTLAHAALPARQRNGHKGSFGVPLIVAGAANYSGAPLLAAKAAMKAGTGLLHLFTPKTVQESAVVALPEAIYPETSGERAFGRADAKLLNRLIDDEDGRFQTCLIGPGLSQVPDFFDHLTLLKRKGKHSVTTIIDADGLNLLGQSINWAERLPINTILTPHPGEMARLLQITTKELIRLNRLDIACQSAAEWGCVVVLKGAYTVIGTPEGKGYVLPFANPVLATAGSGDVLAGVITSFCGQGIPPVEAAYVGAFVHGLAGEFASQSFGDRGLLSSELIEFIPRAIKHVINGQ